MKKIDPKQRHRQCFVLGKMLTIMKLTALFFFIALFQVTASTYAQKTRLNLKFENEKLEKVFNKIEESSDFSIFYKNELIKNSKEVSGEFRDALVSEILDQILKDENLTYSVKDKLIMIVPKEATPAINQSSGQQQKKVSGKVTDTTGATLPGVSVVVKGTTTGIITDSEGKFALSGVPENAFLVFSFVGMKTQEVPVSGKTSFSIKLEDETIGIEEVVAVGYGTVKKSDLTGAVASVNNKDLTAYPSNNLVQSMQGRAAGVSIQSVNAEPGGSFKIRIRGATSINASSDPLFVVDGLVGGEMPPSEDIASVEILKDASGSAIYGSRGANGVVMITTKSGKAGKTKVNINSYYSFQKEIGRLQLLHAHDFAAYINEARNTNFYDLNALTIDTDWQDLIFRKGHIQNHQLSFSGGNDKVQYYVSGVYSDQLGVIKKSDFNRYSLTTNLKFNVNDWISISLNSALNSSVQNGVLSQVGGGQKNAGVVSAALRFEPTAGIMDANGVYTTSKTGIAPFENPMAVLDGRDEENKNDKIQTNIKAEFDITKGLIFNSTYGMIIQNHRGGVYNNRISNQGQGTNGQGSLSYIKNSNFLTEQYLNYTFNLGTKNDFVLTGGYSYQNFVNESFTASNSGFITDALGFWNLGVGTNLIAPSSSYTKSEIASFYGRVNYNFDKRYLITLTSRYDGASQFSEGHKWSYFPSGAFSWNIGNEKFFPQNKALTGLKFRTSYGLTGNQAISAYQSLARISSTYFVVNNTSVTSVLPTSIANQDLTWETTGQFNAGVDLDFFSKRISLTGEYYYKKTNDLLFSVPIASFSGFQTRLDNLGSIENKGYEFQFESRNLVNKLKWSTSFNLTLNTNKVLSLPNNGADIIYTNVPSFSGAVENSILRVGSPVGSFYGFVYQGVYQVGDKFIPGGAFETTPGGEKFADLTNDGILESKDRKIIGNPNPKAVWGCNNDFSYKGFSVNLFFQAITGGDMLNLSKMELNILSGNTNATIDALNRWTPTNTNTNVPKATTGRSPRTSSRFVEDGSFVRLKNLSVGYDFPSSFLSKLKLSSARIYVSGQNLWTLTNYSGVDPEVAYQSSNTNLGLDFGSYPNTISYTLGINLGF
jgi:TonB-dependent starch-binding outer membrane protein SusC